ncbi:hypothetical protein K493DRAFT_66093 [Basidiobolus meristosporus CBS 931.73]|uniref:Uncharacterized protein n=1 Tax=Basidiobolus meristosporus CBS 931.73 TaxID=1314790 RepID=A0A1Y1XVB5_9FUNG|nr:hypothetical protein K493DRAFT_66093 [Basidiobolus meristosporus CBS 931.73]|eukprot:ORX89690.1 hypothetical protein K493DRAFT_66093 [Basidiobolus meristosporus CBS 931.73]
MVMVTATTGGLYRCSRRTGLVVLISRWRGHFPPPSAMNFGEHPAESLEGDPSLSTNPGHFFDLRAESLVDMPFHWKQYFEELQNAMLSQITLNFRSLHERLDGVEEKLEYVLRTSAGNYWNAKVSGIEATLDSLTNTTPKPPHLSRNDHLPVEGTPGRQHIPDSSTTPRPNPNSISNALSPTTPVSQLPSEESAKVKVLLRQFAAGAMNYIDKNATTFLNVNNHAGAISTMKRFGLYESPAWDNFTQLHFPHVLKRDLTDELVKIITVKVKNTKARYKKKHSTSQSTEPNSGLDG